MVNPSPTVFPWPCWLLIASNTHWFIIGFVPVLKAISKKHITILMRFPFQSFLGIIDHLYMVLVDTG